jgi:hypothetical protein
MDTRSSLAEKRRSNQKTMDAEEEGWVLVLYSDKDGICFSNEMAEKQNAKASLYYIPAKTIKLEYFRMEHPSMDWVSYFSELRIITDPLKEEDIHMFCLLSCIRLVHDFPDAELDDETIRNGCDSNALFWNEKIFQGIKTMHALLRREIVPCFPLDRSGVYPKNVVTSIFFDDY